MPILNAILTDQAEGAALDYANSQIRLQISAVGFGTSTSPASSSQTAVLGEVARVVVAGGGIESASKTLTVNAVWKPDAAYNIGQIGFYADVDGADVLFCIFSPDTPIAVNPDIGIAASYALNLSRLPVGSVTVVIDHQVSEMMVLLGQHQSAADPHPQYATDTDLAALGVIVDANDAQNTLEHNNILQLITLANLARFNGDQQLDLRLTNHEQAANPHPQYLMGVDYTPRHLFKLEYNTITPYATHFGRSAGAVSHVLQGDAISLGNCLNEHRPTNFQPRFQHTVEGIDFLQPVEFQGFLLGFEGVIQCSSWAGQGDTVFGGFSASLALLDDDLNIVQNIALPLRFDSGNFGRNGSAGYAAFVVEKSLEPYQIYNVSNGLPPSNLVAILEFRATSDSDGGGVDLQIFNVEKFSIWCKY